LCPLPGLPNDATPRIRVRSGRRLRLRKRLKRHGISAIVLGSDTIKVLTHSKIPVLVHR
jgi:nucleotide-binding universal stress UspA family protein